MDNFIHFATPHPLYLRKLRISLKRREEDNTILKLLSLPSLFFSLFVRAKQSLPTLFTFSIVNTKCQTFSVFPFWKNVFIRTFEFHFSPPIPGQKLSNKTLNPICTKAQKSKNKRKKQRKSFLHPSLSWRSSKVQELQ